MLSSSSMKSLSWENPSTKRVFVSTLSVWKVQWVKEIFFSNFVYFFVCCAILRLFFNEIMFKFHKGHCSTIRWRFCHFKTKFKQNKNLQITIGPINCFRRHNLIWKKKRKSENDKWEEAMKRDETRLDGWPNEKLLSGCVNHIYSGIALLWIHYTHAFNAAGLQSEWLKIHTCTPPTKNSQQSCKSYIVGYLDASGISQKPCQLLIDEQPQKLSVLELCGRYLAQAQVLMKPTFLKSFSY